MGEKERINKKQYAYELLYQRIIDGVYLPGQRLVINQISKEIGSSSIPVREALRLLQADGLVEYKEFTGPVVKFMNETEYIDKFSVVVILEGYAARLSAKYITDDDLAQLEEINKQMGQAVDNYELETFTDLNRKFHMTMYERCKNKFLLEQITSIWESLSLIKGTRIGLSFQLSPKRCSESIKEHNEIIRLLREKAPDHQIESYVRKHKVNTLSIFKEKFDYKD